MKKKMKFNRNKEQLVKIIEDKIIEKKGHYDFGIVKSDID